jgi:uncharacterized membrane protein
MENTTQKDKIGSLHSIIQIIIIITSIILSIYFYQNFPARVPMHWNVAGEIDGWGSRGFGAFLLPGILIAMYFLFELTTRIDPRRERYAEFKKTYSIIKTAIMLVFFCIYIITSLASLGYSVSISFWMPFIIGLLFVVLGNYFGKIRSNFFVGIKVPWTLSNEEVWNKTHRLGGKLFILGGLMMMFMGFMPIVVRMPLFILIMIVVAVLPIVYSYFLYKRLQK